MSGSIEGGIDQCSVSVMPAKIMQVSSWLVQSRTSLERQNRDRSWNIQNRPDFTASSLRYGLLFRSSRV